MSDSRGTAEMSPARLRQGRTLSAQRGQSSRRGRVLLYAALVAAAASSAFWADTLRAGNSGPDVTVIRIEDIDNHGEAGGIRGYSVGTTSCNIGNQNLAWCNQGGCPNGLGDEDHPVIAQNLYRLKDGRFTQIGMSWLKHGFFSTNSFDSNCGSCAHPGSGDLLGPGCTDTYDAGLNGSRPLGRRSEVDPTSGVFPYPPISGGSTADVTMQRMRVAVADLDPTLNPGAQYWVEGHYVASDDAAAGNGLNNASYKTVTVSVPSYNLVPTGATVREQSAIVAWQVVDPGVDIFNFDLPGTPVQRYHVARRVSPLGGPGLQGTDTWHFEYAVHNLNARDVARAFAVRFPASVTISNVGFHDVEQHSGEPYDTADWTPTICDSSVSWSTAPETVNANANALRWGTTFSFWFDATADGTGVVEAIDLLLGPTIFSDGLESGDPRRWCGISP